MFRGKREPEGLGPLEITEEDTPKSATIKMAYKIGQEGYPAERDQSIEALYKHLTDPDSLRYIQHEVYPGEARIEEFEPMSHRERRWLFGPFYHSSFKDSLGRNVYSTEPWLGSERQYFDMLDSMDLEARDPDDDQNQFNKKKAEAYRRWKRNNGRN